jgi:hypothetical protein
MQAAFGGNGRQHRFSTVQAPFSTVYREMRRPENAVA